MAQSIQSVLDVELDYSHIPAVLDLSGEHDFHALLKVRRLHTDSDPRPITLRITDTLLDPSTAFKNGYIEVIRSKKNGRVIPVQDESKSTGESRNTVSTADTPEGTFVTLPSRAGKKGPMSKRLHYDFVVPVRITGHFRHVLIPDRMYCLKVAGDDLGIQWWNYGAKEDLPEPLPPSEPAKLTAQQLDEKIYFYVVKSLAPPPPISVSLSLSSPVVRRNTHHPTLRIEITNCADKPITLKPAGRQNYIKPDTPFPEPFPHRSIADHSPSRENFCLHRVPSGEDCIHLRAGNVSSIGHSDWNKRDFITLKPNEPLIREISFLENAIRIMNRMGDEEGDFCAKIREVELWWCEGTVEEIFGEKTSIKNLPNTRTIPVIPRGENELTFCWET